MALVRTNHCGGSVDEVTFALRDRSIAACSFQESVYAVHTAVLLVPSTLVLVPRTSRIWFGIEVRSNTNNFISVESCRSIAAVASMHRYGRSTVPYPGSTHTTALVLME
eukprot:SAG11_NODE_2995_length_2781_cov_6.108501_2_plen_109_part_00